MLKIETQADRHKSVSTPEAVYDKWGMADTCRQYRTRGGVGVTDAVSYTHLDVYKRQRTPARSESLLLALITNIVRY